MIWRSRTLTVFQIKPAFDGEDKEYSVLRKYGMSQLMVVCLPEHEVPTSIPDNINEGVQDGRLVMTVEDLEGIFDPVVEHVLILIQQHIDENKAVSSGPKLSILLVGGFGSSKYLKKKIEQKVANSTVIQPPDAWVSHLFDPLFPCTGLMTASWSAVIRGAILKAVVRKRKIRAFYGVKFREIWTKEQHEIGPLAEFAQTHKYSPIPKPLLTIKAYL